MLPILIDAYDSSLEGWLPLCIAWVIVVTYSGMTLSMTLLIVSSYHTNVFPFEILRSSRNLNLYKYMKILIETITWCFCSSNECLSSIFSLSSMSRPLFWFSWSRLKLMRLLIKLLDLVMFTTLVFLKACKNFNKVLFEWAQSFSPCDVNFILLSSSSS